MRRGSGVERAVAIYAESKLSEIDDLPMKRNDGRTRDGRVQERVARDSEGLERGARLILQSDLQRQAQFRRENRRAEETGLRLPFC
jgi:hypothetical protein